jgi:O-succinylbenzoate synthase
VRVAGFELYRYRVPLKAPLRLKDATLRYRGGVLIRLLGESGVEGWGEASPLPGFSRESLEGVTEQLRELAGSVPGREVGESMAEPFGEPGLSCLAPSARFGVELAVWNLRASAGGVPLPALISPRHRRVVPLNGLLMGDANVIFREARRMRAAGYRAVKLKVGSQSVAEDASLVRIVSRRLGGAVSLRLDANRAWSFEEAARFFRLTAGMRFEYVEEPLTDPARLCELARTGRIPVALDESLAEMEPEELDEHRHVRAVVLKPTLLGGISRTLRFAERALRLSMKPVISSAYETGIGTAALVALAAGIGEEPVPAGLDTYRQLAGDVVRPRLDLSGPETEAPAPREVDYGYLEPVR